MVNILTKFNYFEETFLVIIQIKLTLCIKFNEIEFNW